MSQTSTSLELGTYIAKIVSAYVANHTVEAAALPSLIQSVEHALTGLASYVMPAPHAEKLHPAVPIKKSVFPAYIVCLEDGKKLKMLKRHLKTAYNLEPDAYRQRWGLPHDYPMVAPAYAEQRSDLAKLSGLGRKSVRDQQSVAEPVVQQIPEGRRGRGRPKPAAAIADA